MKKVLKVVLIVLSLIVLIGFIFWLGRYSMEPVSPTPVVKPTPSALPSPTKTPRDGEPTKDIPVKPPSSPTKLPQVDRPTKDTQTLVGDYTTYYPPAEYRNINQSRAAHLISGTIVKPGEVFSYNATVGERTAENGFVKGYVIKDGLFVAELGGGISQVATTLYNSALLSGMTILERHNHTLYISRYPIGRDATVAWGVWDLQFRNDTKYPIRIKSWVVPSSGTTYGQMHTQMWSTKKVWDVTFVTGKRYNFTKSKTVYVTKRSGAEAMSGSPGFDIKVWQKFFRHGSSTLDHQVTITTRYLPTNEVVIGRPPTPTPTPTPSKSPSKSPTPTSTPSPKEQVNQTG